MVQPVVSERLQAGVRRSAAARAAGRAGSSLPDHNSITHILPRAVARGSLFALPHRTCGAPAQTASRAARQRTHGRSAALQGQTARRTDGYNFFCMTEGIVHDRVGFYTPSCGKPRDLHAKAQNKKAPASCRSLCFSYKRTENQYTLTCFLSLPLRSNLTTPSLRAKSVSSPPMPTLLPGWILVPR